MQKISVAFDWQTDEKGFQLQFDERDRPLCILRKGGSLVRRTPLKLESLYLEFAKITGPSALLAFVNKFGPLTKAGLLLAPSSSPKVKQARGRRIEITETHAGDDVQESLEHARWFEKVLRLSNEHEVLSTFFVRRKPLRLSEGRLICKEGEFRIEYRPDDLIQAMRVQLALSLIDGKRIIYCLHCNEPFEAGTGRRADAKYCCSEHKIAYLSRKRSRR